MDHWVECINIDIGKIMIKIKKFYKSEKYQNVWQKYSMTKNLKLLCFLIDLNVETKPYNNLSKIWHIGKYFN